MSQLELEALDTAFVHAFTNLFNVLLSGWVSGDDNIEALKRFERDLNNQRDAYEEVRKVMDKDEDKSVPR